MGRFITDVDYSTLLRDEIKDILLEDYSDTKLHRAEDMAISQIKNYLFGRYNTEVIFASQEDGASDPRNAHIVMITIDCAVYHLYTSLAPNKIPQHRGDRYQDALNWLKDVGRGNAIADLPKKTDDNGNDLFDFRITSEYPNEDNTW